MISFDWVSPFRNTPLDPETERNDPVTWDDTGYLPAATVGGFAGEVLAISGAVVAANTSHPEREAGAGAVPDADRIGA